MKVLLVILICLGLVLVASTFFADLRMPVHVHWASAVSDGTTFGTHVTGSGDETIQRSVQWLPGVGLVLDIAAIGIVAVRLRR